VVSLAVLADGDPEYRPHSYTRSDWGWRVLVEFPICKLLDLPEERLPRKGDPIARIVQAHRAALATSRDSPERRIRKFELLRHLKQEKDEFGEGELHQVLRLLDWLLQLSEPEEIQLRQDLAKLKPETFMPYVTSFERFARQEGRQEGLQTGELRGLRQAIREVVLTRFGQIPEPVAEALDACTETSRLRIWLRLAASSPTLDDIREDRVGD
jgi:hypothetical protein